MHVLRQCKKSVKCDRFCCRTRQWYNQSTCSNFVHFITEKGSETVDVQVVDGTALQWVPHRTYTGVYARSIIDTRSSPDLEVKVIRITPGAQVPPHTHERSAETFYVLSGKGAFYVGGDWVPCHEGSCAHAKAGIVHGAKNTGEGDLRLLAIFTPPLNYDASSNPGPTQ